MNINDNFEFLNVGLPEDILRPDRHIGAAPDQLVRSG